MSHRLTTVGFLFISLAIAGCTPLVQLSQNIANNAPPALTPTIATQEILNPESGFTNVTIWPVSSDLYIRQEALRFGFYIKRGQLNKMTLAVSSRVPSADPLNPLGSYTVDPVYQFDANHPQHNERWSYVVRDISVSSIDKTMVSLFELMPPVDGTKVLKDLTTFFITFKEESINPRYQGTVSQFAERKFDVTPVAAGQCNIQLFDVLTSPGGVDYKVRGCKSVVIVANGTEVLREVSSSARSDFPAGPYSAAVGFSNAGGKNALGIVAIDAVGQMATDGMYYKSPSIKGKGCVTKGYRDKFDNYQFKVTTIC